MCLGHIVHHPLHTSEIPFEVSDVHPEGIRNESREFLVRLEKTRKQILCKVPSVICDVIERFGLHYVEASAHEVASCFSHARLLLEFGYHILLVKYGYSIVRMVMHPGEYDRGEGPALTMELNGLSQWNRGKSIRLSDQKGVVKQMFG